VDAPIGDPVPVSDSALDRRSLVALLLAALAGLTAGGTAAALASIPDPALTDPYAALERLAARTDGVTRGDSDGSYAVDIPHGGVVLWDKGDGRFFLAIAHLTTPHSRAALITLLDAIADDLDPTPAGRL